MARKRSTPDTTFDPILQQSDAAKYLGQSARKLRMNKRITRTPIPGTTRMGYRLSDLNAEIERAKSTRCRKPIRKAS